MGNTERSGRYTSDDPLADRLEDLEAEIAPAGGFRRPQDETPTPGRGGR